MTVSLRFLIISVAGERKHVSKIDGEQENEKTQDSIVSETGRYTYTRRTLFHPCVVTSGTYL